jgi:hypothetical protein
MTKAKFTWGDIKKIATHLNIPDEAPVRFLPGYMEHTYGESEQSGLVTNVRYENHELVLKDTDWS